MGTCACLSLLVILTLPNATSHSKPCYVQSLVLSILTLVANPARSAGSVAKYFACKIHVFYRLTNCVGKLASVESITNCREFDYRNLWKNLKS